MSSRKKIVVLGFSGSGKTTLVLQLLNPGAIVEDNPRLTHGMEYYEKEVLINNINFSLIDIGGTEIFQKIFWETGMGLSSGVIYMIDGILYKDRALLNRSIQAFKYTLDILPDEKPIVIFINKQDLVDSNPMSLQKAEEIYEFNTIGDRDYSIFPCSAKYGNSFDNNIKNGLVWLSKRYK